MTRGGSYLIRCARVFDGERIREWDSLRIENDVIRDVGVALRAPAGVTIVDAPDGTLLPGLIDAHAHVGSATSLRRALLFGVTTVLDMFMDWRVAQQLKAEEANGSSPDRADLRTSTTLATARSGHGTSQLVGTIPTLDSPEQADAFVAARVDEGADYIKLVHDDFSLHGPPLPTLSPETLRAAVDAAHRYGRLAVVHVGRLCEAMRAVEADADVLAHWVTDELPSESFIETLLAKNVCVLATLSMLRSITGESNMALSDDEHLAGLLSERDRHALRQTIGSPHYLDWRVAQEGIRALHEAGVPVLVGTDAPYPGMTHGASVHGELELLHGAGLSPAAALAAATSLPAARFGLTDRGRIAVGLRADLLLVRGDPTKELAATRRIVGTWKAGRRLDPADTTQPAVVVARPTAVPPSGLLSEAVAGRLAVTIGTGWEVLTDQRIGGSSTASFSVCHEGPDGVGWSLNISGDLHPTIPSPWAGIMFNPGPKRLRAVDLSAWEGIRFAIRGDGRTCGLMIFLASRGRLGAPSLPVPTGPTWATHQFSWRDFDGSDGHDVQGIFVAATGSEGPFELQISDVRLWSTP